MLAPVHVVDVADVADHYLRPQMYTPLHAASASGQVSVVNLLLDLGVEVDAVNGIGNTSLHVACLNGQDIVVNKLLDNGATVNAVNNKGMVSCVILLIINYLLRTF